MHPLEKSFPFNFVSVSIGNTLQQINIEFIRYLKMHMLLKCANIEHFPFNAGRQKHFAAQTQNQFALPVKQRMILSVTYTFSNDFLLFILKRVV